MQASDLEPCKPLAADAGMLVSHALEADTVNASQYVECQALQLGLLGIVYEFVNRGLLTVHNRDPPGP